MGGGSTDEIIMTSISNPEVMAVCYAQGWAAHSDYMTKSEAEAVTDIDNAFTNNTDITHFLEFEHFGVTSLKQSKGFKGCTALESISIPPTLTTVAYQCFQNCTNISKVVIKDMAAWLVINFPYNIDNPINYAHKIYSDENTIVTSLTIPSTITKLGKGCLTGWRDLTSVVIPNNITSIGSNAFANCTNLSSVTLPNTITTLDSQVFAGCGFSGVFAIPEGITTVNNQWIWGNGNITRLEFPSTITSIGTYGFHYNVGNKNVVIKATTPPSYNNSTSYVGTNTKIYVPDANVNTYKTSSYWSNLASYIYPMSELPT